MEKSQDDNDIYKHSIRTTDLYPSCPSRERYSWASCMLTVECSLKWLLNKHQLTSIEINGDKQLIWRKADSRKDSVSHKILLEKRSACDISGDCFTFLYRSYQLMFNVLNGTTSNNAPIERGPSRISDWTTMILCQRQWYGRLFWMQAQFQMIPLLIRLALLLFC